MDGGDPLRHLLPGRLLERGLLGVEAEVVRREARRALAATPGVALSAQVVARSESDASLSAKKHADGTPSPSVLLLHNLTRDWAEKRLRHPRYVSLHSPAATYDAQKTLGGKWIHTAGSSTTRFVYEGLRTALNYRGMPGAINDTCWASPKWQEERDYAYLLACRGAMHAYEATNDALHSRLSYTWKDAMYGWQDAKLFARWCAAREAPDVFLLNSGIHQFYYEDGYWFRQLHSYENNKEAFTVPALWVAHYLNQTAMLVQALDVLGRCETGRNGRRRRGMCVVWKGTNLIPGYYNHLDAFNEVTAAAFLAAGFSVADPGEVTKANVGVADVHHHQNIFNGEILKPLLPALERICPE